jgi:uncharacterized repeat protein (TIGR03803 family)
MYEGRSRIMGVFRWKKDLVGSFDRADAFVTNEWTGDAGPSTVPIRGPFNATDRRGGATVTANVASTASPTLTTLVSFGGGDGANPRGSLIADAAGDLFGTTRTGGADGQGTVFEIAKTLDGYADAPTTLVSFTGADGLQPTGSLIADVAGNLFGTTSGGGADGDGTVFEITKTPEGYASAPTTVVSFTGADGSNPLGSLTADAAGNLFGATSQGGADGDGTVFEISRTKHGYASSPTTLVSFTIADGREPCGSLIADAAGDLFGTTIGGGADGDGTVFEIAKTKRGYAGAPTVLISFTYADGSQPTGSLIADAAGNLFGTTQGGGAHRAGTVFEIAKTKHGYASSPTTLVSFTGADGSGPLGDLIADAAGNLFGTTTVGGAHGDGTVFEIAKTPDGYASAPTVLVSFSRAEGSFPDGSLIADAAGDLFGTTEGRGADNGGTVFEITDSGFVPPAAPVTPAGAAIATSSTPHAAFAQAMAGFEPDRSGTISPTILTASHEAPMVLARPQVA